MTRVYLGLGSNIQREQHLGMALDELAMLLTDMQCSPVFESEAVGIRSAPFFNLVVAGNTDLDPTALSQRLKAIETRSGRYAPDRQGLPLDIDILLHGDLTGEFEGLTLPRAGRWPCWWASGGIRTMGVASTSCGRKCVPRPTRCCGRCLSVGRGSSSPQRHCLAPS